MGEPEEVKLLILVSSAVGHYDRRDAIRQTWASKEHLKQHKTKVIFLLGQGKDQQSAILEESRLQGDIIQEDFHVRN